MARAKIDNDEGTSAANKVKKTGKKVEDNALNKEASGDGVATPSEVSYPLTESTTDGRKFNFKIVSWNVAGLRAWVKKSGIKWLLESDADIICLQETKCSEEKAPEEMKELSDYTIYWNAGEKAGHNGVCLISKVKPENIQIGIPDKPEHSSEGRTLTAEYEKFYLVCCYVPNAGRGLVRLDYRQEWDKDFREYLKKLDEKKPVILCGDLNVSHKEIDLKNPKSNKKNAGFTQQERDGFTDLLNEGFTDSFRKLYPEREGAYTFWTYMGNARAKNVGWRLDYFVLSERLEKDLCDNVIEAKVLGSDHCPISLLMALE